MPVRLLFEQPLLWVSPFCTRVCEVSVIASFSLFPWPISHIHCVVTGCLLGQQFTFTLLEFLAPRRNEQGGVRREMPGAKWKTGRPVWAGSAVGFVLGPRTTFRSHATLFGLSQSRAGVDRSELSKERVRLVS